MNDQVIKGFRCEVHLPDATVLVRKCATRPYEFARCRKTMLPGVITERWGWKLVGMSMTRTGAMNLISSGAARPGDIDEIFPVLAIPIYRKVKPFEAHLAECAKQPDPPKAFRGGLIEAIQENHPYATIEDITEMLDQMGA
jgi:hypothetical protein